jgi:hypothetical protein
VPLAWSTERIGAWIFAGHRRFGRNVDVVERRVASGAVRSRKLEKRMP